MSGGEELESERGKTDGGTTTTAQKELKEEEMRMEMKVVLIHQDDFYRDENWSVLIPHPIFSLSLCLFQAR